MHPRCRSTISAVVEGGKRVAKSKGRNIRVPAEMKYKDYKEIYIEKTRSFEMYRKITAPLTYRPVSEEQYTRLTVPLKKMGVTIMRGGEIEKHLNLMKAQAANLGTDVVLFRDKVTVSAILEETYHVKQNRAGLNDDKDAKLRLILNEIDAKEYLLRVAEKYKIPREEIEETKNQLEEYKKELENYQKER